MEESILVRIPELDYSEDYLADVVNGRIFSVKSNRWLNPKGNKRFGYVYSTFRVNGESRPYSLHSLIMSAHMGAKKDYWVNRLGAEINHINGDKTDNRIENLELVSSHSFQYDDRVRKLLGKGRRLKEHEVCEILEQWAEWQEDEDNKKSDFCNAMSEAFGVSYSTIENIINGKTWVHLSKELISA